MQREEKIVQIIEKNPGIRFREIMDSIGLKNGVLTHYLRKLENKGMIFIERTPRVARFYPLDVTEEEQKIVKRLRQETPKRIIKALVENERLSFKEVTECVSKSPATTSFYMSQLVEDEIVSDKVFERKRVYSLNEPERMKNLIDEYQPDLIEKTTDNMSDIISSL